MNRKMILTATIGLAALTSACTPAQVGRLLVATKHASKPATVVATDTPPVPTIVVIGTPQFPTFPADTQLGATVCQTGNGPQCVPAPVVDDAEFVCGGDQQIDTCEGLYGLPTQVGSAPRLP